MRNSATQGLICKGRNAIRFLGRPSSYRAINTLGLGYKNQSVFNKERVAVYSEICTKHTTMLKGQNVNFVNVKPGIHTLRFER